jgi:hypothetical protein
MTLKRLIVCFFTVAIVQFSVALAAENALKPAEASKPAEAPIPADTFKSPEAPKPAPRPNVNVDILEHSWTSGFVWENFNKTECTWSAKVKNNNPEPRHICLNYEFLDEDNLPVFQNGKCEVVLGNSEGIISGSILVKSPLVQDVKKSNAVPLEAHRLHSFVPSPPPPPPAQ